MDEDAVVRFLRCPASDLVDPALFDGDSEFLRAIKGKDSAAVWAVIDDLMDTLHVTMPRAYNGVMRRIKDL